MLRLCFQPLKESSVSQIFRLAFFWHFLDVVWIFIFTVVYGIGIRLIGDRLMHKTLTSRLIGFIGSLLLTLLAFYLITHPDLFHLGARRSVRVILILAAFQAALQSIFFLNVLSEKGMRWNLIVFGSTLSIMIIILAAGSGSWTTSTPI